MWSRRNNRCLTINTVGTFISNKVGVTRESLDLGYASANRISISTMLDWPGHDTWTNVSCFHSWTQHAVDETSLKQTSWLETPKQIKETNFQLNPSKHARIRLSECQNGVLSLSYMDWGQRKATSLSDWRLIRANFGSTSCAYLPWNSTMHPPEHFWNKKRGWTNCTTCDWLGQCEGNRQCEGNTCSSWRPSASCSETVPCSAELGSGKHCQAKPHRAWPALFQLKLKATQDTTTTMLMTTITTFQVNCQDWLDVGPTDVHVCCCVLFRSRVRMIVDRAPPGCQVSCKLHLLLQRWVFPKLTCTGDEDGEVNHAFFSKIHVSKGSICHISPLCWNTEKEPKFQGKFSRLNATLVPRVPFHFPTCLTSRWRHPCRRKIWHFDATMRLPCHN